MSHVDREAMTEPTRMQSGPGGERCHTFTRHERRVELRVCAPDGAHAFAEHQLSRAEALLDEFGARLSASSPNSELRALNEDHRTVVPATPMLLRFAEAISWAGRRSGGLVDATTGPFAHGWRHIAASGNAVHRPRGVQLASTELADALAADLAAELLRGAPSWLVDCGGALRLGGIARHPRPVDIHDPAEPAVILHRLHVTSGGVSTSQHSRQADDRRDAALTGADLVQVTALAPTALEATVLAQMTLRTGGADAHRVLEHGGVIVHASGVVEVVAPPAVRRHDRRRATPLRRGLPAAA